MENQAKPNLKFPTWNSKVGATSADIIIAGRLERTKMQNQTKTENFNDIVTPGTISSETQQNIHKLCKITGYADPITGLNASGCSVHGYHPHTNKAWSQIDSYTFASEASELQHQQDGEVLDPWGREVNGLQWVKQERHGETVSWISTTPSPSGMPVELVIFND
jgi:hypothetical protein